MTTPESAAPDATAPRRTSQRDAAAAGLTAVVVVLLGAPVGLLWAAVAPRVVVLLGGPDGPAFAERASRAFVDADVAFAGLTLVAGLLCGAGAAWPGRRHGPGVVAGLLAGGLLAAFVASRTGAQVGAEALRGALEDPQARGTIEATVRLLTPELLVAWPVGALAAFALLTALLTRDSAPARDGAVGDAAVGDSAVGQVSSG